MPALASLLIVEDSRHLLSRLVSLASEYVHPDCIAVARDGIEAIQKFDECSPSFVVLDIGLPGLSGLEVLLHIQRRNTSAEVLVFTAFSSLQMETRCRLLGAHHFLDKSCDIERLVELLRNFGASAAGYAVT